jgi:hypothetical protein
MAHFIFFLFFAGFIPFAVYTAIRTKSLIPASFAGKSSALQFGISNGLFILGVIAAFLVCIPLAVFARIGFGGQTLILIGLESSIALILTNILIDGISIYKERYGKYNQRKFLILICVGYFAALVFTILMFN